MFSHEKLIVYRTAIDFVAWTQPVVESLPGKVAARDQLERASNSILLNLDEGNAKFSKPERARFFQIAHVSAVECSACLDVLVGRRLMRDEDAEVGKGQLVEVVNMLLALLNRLGCRVAEDGSVYLPEEED